MTADAVSPAAVSSAAVSSESGGPDAVSPESRLARWTAADAAIGLAAERDELRSRLTDRDREVADLRARLANLTNANGQLQAEKSRLVAQVQHRGGVALFGGRAYRKVRRTAGRMLRG